MSEIRLSSVDGAGRTRAKASWAEKFARLQIETPSESVKTIFYTGLYHVLLYPREIGEYGRYYSTGSARRTRPRRWRSSAATSRPRTMS